MVTNACDSPKRGPSGRQSPLPFQELAANIYDNVVVQVFVAFLIVANFATNIIEKQIDPFGKHYSTIFAGFDFFYNICFTLELGVNLYANWFCRFWRSGWNVFDAVVVSIGVINMLKLPLPKAFSLLRMMRAFRVFRLFKRVKALNKIIVAIVKAVPGVANAFLILTIIMCIYAILGVELFMYVGEGSTDCNRTATANATAEKVGYQTVRDFCVGTEYFGSFSRAIYTFFQILTGESWSEMIARPVVWYYADDWVLAAGAALYFVSFIIISGFILTNVVVAVLLDKMSDAESNDAVDKILEEAALEDGEEPPEKVPEAEKPLTEREKDFCRKNVELQRALDKLTAKVNNNQEEFDNMRRDVAATKEQIATCAKLFEAHMKKSTLGKSADVGKSSI